MGAPFTLYPFTDNATIIGALLRADVDGMSFIIGHFQSLLLADFDRRSQQQTFPSISLIKS
jgi:hypothetical protein